MTRAYNNALVLVRFLAALFIILGAMGFAYMAFALIVYAGGGDELRWLVDPALNYSAQGFFGNPIYVVTGLILLWKSVPIARFIAKHCEAE